eukprot:TRINITY_DN5362_c1_g3_i1.p1 TRINITY_DN5362_c1_g3~~TRINITY_DN5362_c1_g3_i1.p1  ORF type:complete len:322 (-),score=48.44 TRINITY_DN5362_c1_g3_i1:468-1433(-)
MYRSCVSKSVLGDLREFLGSDERKLLHELRAVEQELKSEREASHRAADDLNFCRGEFLECEAARRRAHQELQDMEHEKLQERMEVCALRLKEKNMRLGAPHEAAKVRCEAFREGARKGEEIMLAQYEDSLARAVQRGREEGFADGARKGEEMMLLQFQDALARAVQCGREEGSAEIRAELTETSQSLRDKLDIAEAWQRRTIQKLAKEECESSRYREATAHEIAELRKELACARHEEIVRMKPVAVMSGHLRDVDVTRQEYLIANVDERGAERNAELSAACNYAVPLSGVAIEAKKSSRFRVTHRNVVPQDIAADTHGTAV